MPRPYFQDAEYAEQRYRVHTTSPAPANGIMVRTAVPWRRRAGRLAPSPRCGRSGTQPVGGRTAALLEGLSDLAVVEALAKRHGWDLAAGRSSRTRSRAGADTEARRLRHEHELLERDAGFAPPLPAAAAHRPRLDRDRRRAPWYGAVRQADHGCCRGT